MPEARARAADSMWAAYIERTGPADEIRYGQLPVPSIGPRAVLVQVEAVAANYVDTYIRSGAFAVDLEFPFIIGRDLAGTVVRVGAGVTRFSAGQRVWCDSQGYDGRQGSFAEFARVDEERLYPLPPGIAPLEAVAAFHPMATAYMGLVARMGGVHPGQVVLVGGAAGNVGSTVVRLASTMGARVVATAHGATDLEWCRRCGATDVLEYQAPDLVAAVRQITPDGVDVVWNTSGQNDLEQVVGMLARGGTLLLMAGLTQLPRFPVGPFYTGECRAIGFTITHATLSELRDAARAINALLGTGVLPVRIARRLPLSQAVEAHRLLEGGSPSGKAHGRVVLYPDALPPSG